MQEHSKQTRQQVAADILSAIQSLEEVMKPVPHDKWADIIGKAADEELSKNWVSAILQGMQEGTITVGDSRLADTLYAIEKSIEAVPIEIMERMFTEHTSEKNPQVLQGVLQAMRSAVSDLSWATFQAITTGLTTPGQDLFAGQSRPLFPNR